MGFEQLFKSHLKLCLLLLVTERERRNKETGVCTQTNSGLTGMTVLR